MKLDQESFVLADIPGLIEGAHKGGAGLGQEFLRHLERTRVLIHVVDAAGTEGRDPVADYAQINTELALYDEQLAKLPQVVAANKMDLPEGEANLLRLEKAAAADGRRVFPISAVTRHGLKEILYHVLDVISSLPIPEKTEELSEEVVYRLTEKEDGFNIRRQDGVFIIEGQELERLVAMTDFSQEQAVARFQRIITRMGVERPWWKQVPRRVVWCVLAVRSWSIIRDLWNDGGPGDRAQKAVLFDLGLACPHKPCYH